MLSDDGVIVQFTPMIAPTYDVSDVMKAHSAAGLELISRVPFIWLKSDRDKKQSGGNVINVYETMIVSKKQGKSTTMYLSAMPDASNVIVAPVSTFFVSTILVLCICFVNRLCTSCDLSFNACFVC